MRATRTTLMPCSASFVANDLPMPAQSHHSEPKGCSSINLLHALIEYLQTGDAHRC